MRRFPERLRCTAEWNTAELRRTGTPEHGNASGAKYMHCEMPVHRHTAIHEGQKIPGALCAPGFIMLLRESDGK